MEQVESINLRNKNVELVQRAEEALRANSEIVYLLRQNLRELEHIKEELKQQKTTNTALKEKILYLNGIIIQNETQVADLLLQSNGEMFGDVLEDPQTPKERRQQAFRNLTVTIERLKKMEETTRQRCDGLEKSRSEEYESLLKRYKELEKTNGGMEKRILDLSVQTISLQVQK